MMNVEGKLREIRICLLKTVRPKLVNPGSKLEPSITGITR